MKGLPLCWMGSLMGRKVNFYPRFISVCESTVYEVKVVTVDSIYSIAFTNSLYAHTVYCLRPCTKRWFLSLLVGESSFTRIIKNNILTKRHGLCYFIRLTTV